ncbi:hypothetical protein ACFQ2B_34395 [Streptomyces stramineus]
MEHSPMRMRRTTRLIRSSDPGLYHLSLPLTGTMRVDQAGDQFPYSPRDLVLLDTSRPYTLDAVPDPHRDRILGTGLFVPRELLPSPSAASTTSSTGRCRGVPGSGTSWPSTSPASGPRPRTAAPPTAPASAWSPSSCYPPCSPTPWSGIPATPVRPNPAAGRWSCASGRTSHSICPIPACPPAPWRRPTTFP